MPCQPNLQRTCAVDDQVDRQGTAPATARQAWGERNKCSLNNARGERAKNTGLGVLSVIPSDNQDVWKPVKSVNFWTVSKLAVKGRFPGLSRGKPANKPFFRFSSCFPLFGEHLSRSPLIASRTIFALNSDEYFSDPSA